jgi:alpha-galactosidase
MALTVLTAVASPAAGLRVNGASRIGVPTAKPFLYLIPASGRELKFSAVGLPQGLTLDAQTGIITGVALTEGSFNTRVMIQAPSGETAAKDLELVVGKKTESLTPIMGWNPWYVWGCNIDDQKVRDAADMLVSTGLAAHGYNYINLDDCWQGTRNADGEMVPNARFPDMKALADYVHARGLKIGIYTSPGQKTCAGYEGTKDADVEKTQKSYLDIDVQTYAKWDMDFVKYDYCIFPKDAATRDAYLSKQQAMYQRMTDAIQRSPRSMVHMICQYGENNVFKWGAQVGGNLWRTNHDLADEWAAIVRNGFKNLPLSQFAGPGHWNDLDMLMVGKANWPSKLGQYDIPNQPPRKTKLTVDEQKTHMSLWSLMSSPLLFSGDLSQLDPLTVNLLTNDDVLDVNQDALGAPVTVVGQQANEKIVVKRMSDGSVAVGFFNLRETPATMTAKIADLGLGQPKSLRLRNLWTGKEMIVTRPAVSGAIPAHGVIFVRLWAQR